MNEMKFPTLTVEWMGKKIESIHLIAMDNSNSWITDHELDDYFQEDEKSIQVVYSYILESNQAIISFEKYESLVSDLLKAHVEYLTRKGVLKVIVIETFCVDIEEVYLMMSPIIKKYDLI